MTRLKRQGLLAAVAACVCLLSVSPAAAKPTSASSAQPTAPHRVLLVTGDVVLANSSPSGELSIASIIPAHADGPAGMFRSFTQDGHLYVVPVPALPYLGTRLDPSLFDISAAGSSDDQVDVVIRFRGPAGTAVPGISPFARSGNQARATMTSESARAFGAALARQWQADHGSATRRTGLFAALDRLSRPVPGVSVSRRVEPHFPMRTLTVRGHDIDGRPANGDSVEIVNVDDQRIDVAYAVLRQGVARFSVPIGHYMAVVDYFGQYPDRTVHEVVQPQFSVTADRTIVIDAGSADRRFSVRTPQRAVTKVQASVLARTDGRGRLISSVLVGGSAYPYFVNHTRARVTVGTFHFYLNTRLFSPASVASPYTYDLTFPSEGATPADAHYVVHEDALAVVDASYPSMSSSSQGFDARIPRMTWQRSGFLVAYEVPLRAPAQRREYYTATPDLTWRADHFQLDHDRSHGELQGSFRTLTPATTERVTWGAQPLHPRLYTDAIWPSLTPTCPACIAGSQLDLRAMPFSDNAPEHYGVPDYEEAGLDESMRYTVYADDVPVGTGALLDTQLTVPSEAQQYRVDYETHRSAPYFPLSTDTRTRWTIPTTAPTAPRPSGWACGDTVDSPVNCRVLPLIVADYSMPLDALGRLTPGNVSGTIHVDHLGGSSIASRLTCQVSFDNGTTWRAVRVHDDGAGTFGTSFAVPQSAAGGYGSIRVGVHDAYGGAFAETILRAFAVESTGK